MNTPSLSKKQQKKSLSGKKTPVKGLRNVLSQPCNFFWPIIRNDKDPNIDELKTLLKVSMPAMKRPSLGIPWSRLHRMKKTERRTAREEARSKLDASAPDQDILNSVVAGVNGVTRLLERNDAACVLLEANVDPMLVVKHVVAMAEYKNVPIILVDFLKSVTLETVGFASVAFALKKTVARLESHHFHKLYEKIVQLATKVRCGDNEPPKRNREEESAVETQTIDCSEANEEKIKPIDSSLFKLPSDIYMYRDSRDRRVFVPDDDKKETLNDGVDFISIDNNCLDFSIDDESSAMRSESRTRYVDVRKKDGKISRDESKDDRLHFSGYISLSSDSKFASERKTKILETSENNLADSKTGKSSTIANTNDQKKKTKKNRDAKIKYESLKVKRIQGNFNRLKATKITKRNKK